MNEKNEKLIDSAVYSACSLCPRMCGVDRNIRTGFCGQQNSIRIAAAFVHRWEEPCLSGDFGRENAVPGSGAVFFTGCSLRCSYCQNSRISHKGFGKEVSSLRLSEIFCDLQRQGAANIDLVTPTHFIPGISEALKMAKERGGLTIPVIYNCGGYERKETIESLDGLVDIYLPDYKYDDPVLSQILSDAPDYSRRAFESIAEMLRQTGFPVFDDKGMMKKGTIIRHMVLPGCSADSLKVLERLNQLRKAAGCARLKEQACFPVSEKSCLKDDLQPFLISLLNQYTPPEEMPEIHTETYRINLNRKVTTYEYEKVRKAAAGYGFAGYIQDKSSADGNFVPDFCLQGV